MNSRQSLFSMVISSSWHEQYCTFMRSYGIVIAIKFIKPSHYIMFIRNIKPTFTYLICIIIWNSTYNELIGSLISV